VKQKNIKKRLRELEDISEARKFFPMAESCVYLDSAHYAPYSLETERRLREYIERFTHTNDNLSVFNNSIMKRIRALAAKVINADESEIIITGSTTQASPFANGIQLSEGDCAAYADPHFPR